MANAKKWSSQDVARRWFALFPPYNAKRQLIESAVQDVAWIKDIRKRLFSTGLHLTSLKEHLARLAYEANDCKRTFFNGRLNSIAVLDEESSLTVCAYVDLNLSQPE